MSYRNIIAYFVFAEGLSEHRYNIQTVMNKTGLDRTIVSNLCHDKVKRGCL